MAARVEPRLLRTISSAPFALSSYAPYAICSADHTLRTTRDVLLCDTRVVPQNIRDGYHADDLSILRHSQMPGGLLLHHTHGVDNRPTTFNGSHRRPHAGFDNSRIGIQPIGHHLAGQDRISHDTDVRLAVG